MAGFGLVLSVVVSLHLKIQDNNRSLFPLDVDLENHLHLCTTAKAESQQQESESEPFVGVREVNSPRFGTEKENMPKK